MPTAIQWTDETSSLWWGCEKFSEACKNCYAEGISNRFGKRFGATESAWGKSAPRIDMRAIAETTLADIATRWRKKDRLPRVFINSMSDWLDDAIPIEWLADLLWTLNRYPAARYQLLTKRPHLWQQRMKAVQVLNHPAASIAGKWLDGEAPPNFWIGATVESNKHRHRIDVLYGIPAFVRFLSCEPLLEDLDLSDHLWKIRTAPDSCDLRQEPINKLHWIIAGGESGHGSRPTHPEWIRSLCDQAHFANIPFFFKQWGSWIPVDHTDATKGKTCILAPNGQLVGHLHITDLPLNSEPMIRLGSKHTGRLLDGQEFSNFPA